jgi:hypothetical protein
MPELPEVETVARQLHPLMRGRRVSGLVVYDEKLRGAVRHDLAGRSVTAVGRLGKQVLVTLAGRGDASLWLAVHLRMTGRLVWRDSVPSRDEPHVRACLELDGGAVALIDPRRFGTLAWLDVLDGKAGAVSTRPAPASPPMRSPRCCVAAARRSRPGCCGRTGWSGWATSTPRRSSSGPGSVRRVPRVRSGRTRSGFCTARPAPFSRPRSGTAGRRSPTSRTPTA